MNKKERIGIYPGTFDPVTLGHLDIILRASEIFDKIIIAVSENPYKNPLFSLEERIDMLRKSVKHPRVTVESFSGLLVDYVANKNASVIIRGLRSATDFNYEFLMAQTNNKLSKNIETIFLISKTEYSFISSSLVREIASYGGNIAHFVPEIVGKMVKTKIYKKKT
ncbi:MAG: pantetheine-phosphate adenylyltransferase [Ignavibacteria bacterium]|nr:pantetheine-phosphate adenylyltransferase [Ignavibacteria bacterium]